MSAPGAEPRASARGGAASVPCAERATRTADVSRLGATLRRLCRRSVAAAVRRSDSAQRWRNGCCRGKGEGALTRTECLWEDVATHRMVVKRGGCADVLRCCAGIKEDCRVRGSLAFVLLWARTIGGCPGNQENLPEGSFFPDKELGYRYNDSEQDSGDRPDDPALPFCYIDRR